MLKIVVRVLVCAVFFFGGIAHFLVTDDFAGIVPPFLPWPELIVWVTGVLEFFLVIGILLPSTRLLTGKLAALYCLLVLPANIYQAISDVPIFGSPVAPELLWLRIPLQFVLIAAILWSTSENNQTLIHKSTGNV
ncbi:DoxX family protein [Zhongshania aliphaticivorans]|uniref:DoxX family protein n=1 Tax=Zhongshania aliphaticivorans TaxID=1470434 RepID=UPI0012E60616|nr:hypothetical protein [Zhongshania aliphaticivorans]CAA0100201.1 Uncharacterised protein [Zhongshania aliphaticivorans]